MCVCVCVCGGGGGAVAIPLSDFSSCGSCIFSQTVILSIYTPLVQIPMYLCKKNSKSFAVQKVRGKGVATTPPSSEGRGATEINTFS